jgi:hypothetical protein
VFELNDGRHIALDGAGSAFHLSGGFGLQDFHIMADSLAKYLDGLIGERSR